MDIIKTHMEDLDKALGGGIPKNNTILLSGGPGCGKTILGMQYLINGIKEENQNGIYFTYSEPEEKLITNLSLFNFFDIEMVKKERLKIIDLRYLNTPDKEGKKNHSDIIETVNVMKNIISETNAGRIVIDTISAFYSARDEEARRDFFFHIQNVFYLLKCTPLLISDTPLSDERISPSGVEEYLSDGIIYLEQIEKNNLLIKTLKVIKMRGANPAQNRFRMDISENGIKLLPLISDNR